MTCEDYGQPPDWWYRDDITDQQRSDWMAHWRCYRQAMQQDTAWRRRMEQLIEREQRLRDSRPDTVDTADWR